MSSWKQRLLESGMKLAQHPAVSRLATDPRVVRTLMQALQVPGKVQSFTKEQIAEIAKKLNLASEDDLAQLRRTVRRLEEELARERASR